MASLTLKDISSFFFNSFLGSSWSLQYSISKSLNNSCIFLPRYDVEKSLYVMIDLLPHLNGFLRSARCMNQVFPIASFDTLNPLACWQQQRTRRVTEHDDPESCSKAFQTSSVTMRRMIFGSLNGKRVIFFLPQDLTQQVPAGWLHPATQPPLHSCMPFNSSSAWLAHLSLLPTSCPFELPFITRPCFLPLPLHLHVHEH